MSDLTKLWKAAFRPALAYYCACFAVLSLTGLIIKGVDLAMGWGALDAGLPQAIIRPIPIIAVLALYGFIVFAIPVVILIQIARGFELPRGWADALIPAVLAALIWFIAFELPGFGAINTPGLSFAPLWIAAFFGTGGFLYWLFAGRPRPPYPIRLIAEDLVGRTQDE